MRRICVLECRPHMIKSALWVLKLLIPILLLYITIVPDYAFASSGNAISNTFCNIIKLFSGHTGHALKVVCLIIFGFLLLTGKISLEKSMMEIVGTALVVGAGSVVVALGGATSTCP